MLPSTRPRILAAFAMAGLAYQAAPLAAQHYQCSPPRTVAVPRIEREARPRPLPITGYTLALSWSPEFCKPRKGRPQHARQCNGRDGLFGLVVHGLWPNSGRSWPQWCTAPRQPLGSCMAQRPATYFKVTRILWQGLRFPDFDRVSREDDLTAGIIRRRFVDANHGWKPDAVGVLLNSRGWLEELRLCYDKRFMPTACDRQRFGARDETPAKIWRGL